MERKKGMSPEEFKYLGKLRLYRIITYLPYNGSCMAYLSSVKDGSTN